VPSDCRFLLPEQLMDIVGNNTSRERVLLALNHREPDRVPVDLGTSNATSITVPAYERLKAYLSIDAPTRIMDRIYQVVEVDEAILQRFSVDTRLLALGKPDNWQDIELADDCYQDEWGVVRRRPASSFCYDLHRSPLSGEISLHDVLRYPWPDPQDPGRFRGLRERTLALRATDYAVVFPLGAGIVHQSQFLRGFEDWFVDLIWQPDLMGALMDATLDVRLEIARQALSLVGDLVDVVFVGDDLGTQTGLLMSPQTYRRVIKPRQKRAFDLIHSLTPARLAYHTCGSVAPLIDDLIEVGVEALNPVQVSARNMDTQVLKARFGSRVAFWGGIDSQRILPCGTPDEVRQEVRLRIAHLAPGGGYVLTSVHNIQPDVPPENICALFDAAREEGGYPLAGSTAGQRVLDRKT
jgi:uroporphyrinogen decarboxylase